MTPQIVALQAPPPLLPSSPMFGERLTLFEAPSGGSFLIKGPPPSTSHGSHRSACRTYASKCKARRRAFAHRRRGVEGSSTDVVHTEALLYTPYVYMYHASICIKKRA